MKILLLTKYSELGASSRLRNYQYLPWLRANGFDITVAPLLDDEYVRRLYTRQPANYARIVLQYLRRVWHLQAARRFDLLWIEKEIFPYLPAWTESLATRGGVPYVVDYDDAVFHSYDLNQRRIVRLLLSKKIDQVMRSAALVVVGNQYLAERARQAGAKWVEYLPTSIPLTRYVPVKRKPDAPFTVVWIGTPVTAKFLRIIERPLAEASLHCRLTLKLIGSGPVQMQGIRTEVLPWSEEKEVAELQSSDIGVMPLFDTPFDRGKCGYKLIQYMGCGKAVVASPVGANRTIVSHGTTGFLAEFEKDWTNSILRLHDDPELRARMGAAGRQRVESEYCTEVNAPRLAELLTKAAHSARTGKLRTAGRRR